ncbi:MAG: tetratricopeptide repeat protein [Candidatus Sericytochromatia bacterium]|nr:tetratricopeptide repeat protein [Candidatus Sericytochromatia bacterium]
MNKFLLKIKDTLFIIVIFLFIFISPSYASKRIAVLPFEVLDNDPKIKQFGIGTMDTLTNALGNIPEFIMIDRGQLNAVMKEVAFQNSGFTDSKTTIKLGRLLNAEILVLGTIQVEDKNYRVNVHFTDVESGVIIKSLSPVTGTSIFNIQDQLALEIVKQQNIQITSNQKELISDITNATDNITAYDYYTKGRNSYLIFDKDFSQSVKFFDQALAIDPNYTLALASKAETLSLWAYQLQQSDQPYKDILQKAEITANQALQQNNNLAQAYRALSSVYNIKHNFEEGRNSAKKAIDLSPNDGESYFWLWANTLDHSIDDPLIKKTLQLNPFFILAYLTLGDEYNAKGENDEAIKQYQKVLTINPDSAIAYYNIGVCYNAQGKYDQAIELYKKAILLNPNDIAYYDNLGIIYYYREELDEAIKLYQKAISINPNNYMAYYLIGLAYKKQGKYEQAIIQFKNACKLGSSDSCEILKKSYAGQNTQ